MNSVLALHAQQCGNYNWKQFDSVLLRLSAHNHDCWQGMTPSHFHADFNPEPPIFSAKFANCNNHRNVLAIANEDGKIAVQNTNLKNNNDEQQPLNGDQCHHNAVFDLEWVPGQMQLVSASGDHTARLWQLRDSKFELVRIFQGHNRSVKTAAFRKLDPTCFATGGRDNAILIWDIRSRSNAGNGPKADNCILSGHTGGPGTPAAIRRRTTRQTPRTPSNVPSNSITGLVFQDDYTLVSCGAGDGVIKVWDLRRNYSCYKKEPLPKHSIPYPGSSTLRGYTNLVLDSTGRKLYVNCMDHNIYCFNFGVYDTRPVMTYSGSTNSTFYIKSSLSGDDQYLISGSSDEKAYIWNVDNPAPLLTLSGHTREVTSVAWARTNDLRIVTCSDDARHNIWRLKFNTDDDDTNTSLNYRGVAEPCAGYGQYRTNHKLRLKSSLENTPRSVKRLVEQNETTPILPMKLTSKRSHSDMCGDDLQPSPNGSAAGGDSKRQLIETRARRLFAPSSTAIPLDASPQSIDSGFKSILTGIAEETDTSPTQQPTEKLLLSPLNERNQINTGLRLLELRGRLSTSHPSCSTTALLSPTSNLPNYVIDGDAPHLKLHSPRKLKENVDWLTKIRKQRQLSFINGGAATANDRRTDDQSNGDQHVDGTSLNDSSILSSRVRKIKSSEQSAFGSLPSRRLSMCGGHNGTNERGTPSHMNNSAIVTTPKRRNSETTLLRFFCITPTTKDGQKTPTSTKNGQLASTTTLVHAHAQVTETANQS